MKVKDLGLPPLGGGSANYLVQYGTLPCALLRVSQDERLNDHLRYYYSATGFRRDGGTVNRRTAHEQHDFCQRAARVGLAVLPPLALAGKHAIYPFLEQSRTLEAYLRAEGGDSKKNLLAALFVDMRTAHRFGLIYGDRNPGNILVDGKGGFTHVDFELALAGRTAREFEVAELSSHILHRAGVEVIPTLAATVGTLSRETPRWIDMNKTVDYMRQMGGLLCELLGADANVQIHQEALTASMLAMEKYR